MDGTSVLTELDLVGRDFRWLLTSASAADLRRRSDRTRWTNRQLLFHMLFGYLLVANLRPLVWAFAHSPRPVSRGFARALNAASRPFHVINYLGSLGGGRVLGRSGMAWLMDTIVSRLQKSLRRAPDPALAQGMHFPVRWDPYFHDFMTVLEVYHYATQHYDHHRLQLTLTSRGFGRAEHPSA